MRLLTKKLLLGLVSAALLSSATAAPVYQMQITAKGLRSTEATPAPAPPEVLPPMAAPQYVVLTSGASYALPLNAAQLTTWVIGAGGGGAGAIAVDGTAGGGGAAGGLAYGQMAVSKGTVVEYSLRLPGAGGVGAVNGAKGGDTVLTVNGATLGGQGGSGGLYNTSAANTGGGYTGSVGIPGGRGGYAQGDRGGAGGGAIGASAAANNTAASGGVGAPAADFNGLADAISKAGYTWGGGGIGGVSGSGTTANKNHGGAAPGFGSGGGGAGYYGGNGGAGFLGGGGGGAAGYSGTVTGGPGGQGVVVLKIE